MKEDNMIVFIIVLYKLNLEDSISYTTLVESLKGFTIPYKLIIFNNYNKIKIQSSDNYIVVNTKENIKLSGAYNHGLEFANRINAKWMLLLDQDTELSKDFIKKLNIFLAKDTNNEIVSVVPKLYNKTKHISPHKVYFFNCIKKTIFLSGIYKNHVVALNSATLISVDFLNSIGGFSIDFPLDMLDYWTCFQIYKNNKKIFVLDTKLNHHLSVSNRKSYISVDRYTSLISAEKKYIKEFSVVDKLLYKLRLILRWIKQLIIVENKQIAFITFKNIFS